ncbi:MAG: hypothetical protein WDN03_06930 [Rhizomicrobium sp.]
MSAAVTSPSLYGAGPSSATVPFRLDDNRIFVAVAFRRPDGTARKALAMVNMGAGALVLSNALFRELAPLPGNAAANDIRRDEHRDRRRRGAAGEHGELDVDRLHLDPAERGRDGTRAGRIDGRIRRSAAGGRR